MYAMCASRHVYAHHNAAGRNGTRLKKRRGSTLHPVFGATFSTHIPVQQCQKRPHHAQTPCYSRSRRTIRDPHLPFCKQFHFLCQNP
ncbi:hypothetical protein TNCV_1722851 [Trichonephila clavipes]|nr:hypothetical protein TNCV_1722851 [Trichonephila clavipes]